MTASNRNSVFRLVTPPVVVFGALLLVRFRTESIGADESSVPVHGFSVQDLPVQDFSAQDAPIQKSPVERSKAEQFPAKSATNTNDKANDTANEPAKTAAKKQRPMMITPEREAAVMAFVERHHPELRELLITLRANHPRQFESAVRDLYRTSERLALYHERDEEKYEHELRVWKLRSRVQLLVARYKMSPTAELREQIERTLHEEIDEQNSWLKKEKNRTLDQLKKIDEQIGQLENGRAKVVQQKMAALEAKTGSKGAKSNKKKP